MVSCLANLSHAVLSGLHQEPPKIAVRGGLPPGDYIQLSCTALIPKTVRSTGGHDQLKERPAVQPTPQLVCSRLCYAVL